MNQPLTAARRPVTVYDKSKSLYGGREDHEDDADLSTDYKASNNSKKHKKQKLKHKQTLQPRAYPSRSQADDAGVEEEEITAEPIIGTSQMIEKEYYRLTSDPLPSAVRPLSVLRQSLVSIQSKWKDSRDYSYCCSQLKAIRQDLTVQHVRSKFVCEVYETHGRIAIEQHDFGEFNQILTPLSSLYHEGHVTSPGAQAEFIAYRILLACHHHRWNDLSLMSLITALTPPQQQDPHIRHALAVRSSLSVGNYVLFFQLFDGSPGMSAYLLDHLALEMRMKALKIICAAYRPKVQVKWLSKLMVMENDDECLAWLVSMELPMTLNNSAHGDTHGEEVYELDCKDAQLILQQFTDRGHRIDATEQGDGEQDQWDGHSKIVAATKHRGGIKTDNIDSDDEERLFLGQPGSSKSGSSVKKNGEKKGGSHKSPHHEHHHKSHTSSSKHGSNKSKKKRKK